MLVLNAFLVRTLKKDGLDLEATQHEEASRIMKLAALEVIASYRIMLLADARDGRPSALANQVRRHHLTALPRHPQSGTRRGSGRPIRHA